MECNVCYAISNFALFHSHYLSCYSKELEKDYVVMLKLEGISNQALLKSTILPNITVIYIQEVAHAFVIAVLDISALSFISLGAQRPTPEWGQ